MPAKVTDRAQTVKEIDRWEDGVGWLAHPEEIMERASHALDTDAGVWLVDPLDGDGVDDLVMEYGTVEGVVVLSNHHTRDAASFGRRHGVAVHLPDAMRGVADSLDAPVVRVTDRLPGTDYEVREVAIGSNWYEFALYDGETLVVPESVGTADYIRVGDERLGVMILRRLTPPRGTLGRLSPERILVGHGAGIFEDAEAALADALVNARRRFPRALIENGPRQLRTVTAALRR